MPRDADLESEFLLLLSDSVGFDDRLNDGVNDSDLAAGVSEPVLDLCADREGVHVGDIEADRALVLDAVRLMW
ncbi:MAG: hypothetical protein EKK49_14110 [Rhodocyclaceae bacterium]|nr:MAG: hypothetical protein EKK49_14110 [Rhodocyclaceae bacterium]